MQNLLESTLNQKYWLYSIYFSFWFKLLFICLGGIVVSVLLYGLSGSGFNTRWNVLGFMSRNFITHVQVSGLLRFEVHIENEKLLLLSQYLLPHHYVLYHFVNKTNSLESTITWSNRRIGIYFWQSLTVWINKLPFCN